MDIDERLEQVALRPGLAAGRNFANRSVGLLLFAEIQIRTEYTHTQPWFDFDIHEIFDKKSLHRRNAFFFLKHFIGSGT